MQTGQHYKEVLTVNPSHWKMSPMLEHVPKGQNKNTRRKRLCVDLLYMLWLIYLHCFQPCRRKEKSCRTWISGASTNIHTNNPQWHGCLSHSHECPSQKLRVQLKSVHFCRTPTQPKVLSVASRRAIIEHMQDIRSARYEDFLMISDQSQAQRLHPVSSGNVSYWYPNE